MAAAQRTMTAINGLKKCIIAVNNTTARYLIFIEICIGR